MKKIKIFAVITIVMLVAYTANLSAQKINKSEIPAAVLTSLTAKYPKAEVKKWDLNESGYTATLKDGRTKYDATFDANGNWIKTIARAYYWKLNLPAPVKQAFRKNKYASWNVYGVNTVETPAGQYYQVLIDDSNHPIDAFHQEQYTTNLLLEYKANGEFIGEKKISGNPTI